VAKLNLARFVPVWLSRKKGQQVLVEDATSSVGRRIARVCSELGPTFIKLGQILSTRPDIVPPDILRELQGLQDKVPPFDTKIAMTVLESELRRPLQDCFRTIDEHPVASGSIGQVYRATTTQEHPVVVKIQRPGIHEIIKLDMQILRWLAKTLESVMPEMRVYRPTIIVNELDEMLMRELDYINEAAVTQRFEEAFRGEVGLRIPKVHWEYSGARVLTLERLEGTNIRALLAGAASEETVLNRGLIARRLVDCYLRQVFELGVFHADPHPGNVLIEAPAAIGLIDFGQVGTISDELMMQLIVILYGAVHKEVNVVVDALADLGAIGSDVNRRELQRSLQLVLDKYYGLPLNRFDLATLFEEFTAVVRRHDVAVPREVLMLFKALGLVHGVALRLDPELNLLELLQPRLKEAVSRQLSPRRMSRGAGIWGWQLLNIVRQAPYQLREGLRKIGAGAFQLNVQHENIQNLTNELDRSSNRLAFSVVIAAIIVGSSVVVSAGTQLTIMGVRVQYFGVVGYLIAGVLGLGLSWAIFRSGRLH